MEAPATRWSESRGTLCSRQQRKNRKVRKDTAKHAKEYTTKCILRHSCCDLRDLGDPLALLVVKGFPSVHRHPTISKKASLNPPPRSLVRLRAATPSPPKPTALQESASLAPLPIPEHAPKYPDPERLRKDTPRSQSSTCTIPGLPRTPVPGSDRPYSIA